MFFVATGSLNGFNLYRFVKYRNTPIEQLPLSMQRFGRVISLTGLLMLGIAVVMFGK